MFKKYSNDQASVRDGETDRHEPFVNCLLACGRSNQVIKKSLT
jgi:hypothetical protein